MSTSAPLPRSRPVRVGIPALDVAANVVSLGLTANGAMEVPVGAAPVGWYDGSPTPGQVGPSILAGHVTWNSAKGVFFDLARLQRGERITVDRADGRRAVFAVTKVEQHPKSQFPTLRVYGNTDGPELRLITCAGDFDAAGREYADNVVVFARLVSASRS